MQVALLRANLGGSTTTAGLGGNQAPEPLDYDNPCVKQIIGLVPFDKGGCMGPGDDPPTILILSWPYTFPGDVIPAVTISALYAAPQDRGAPAAAESSPNRDKAIENPRSTEPSRNISAARTASASSTGVRSRCRATRH